MLHMSLICKNLTRSVKENGREPKRCLGQVFHIKLGSFDIMKQEQGCKHTPISKVENPAQFVHE